MANKTENHSKAGKIDENVKIDENDRAILRLLQIDGTMALEAIAGELSLSTNSCWRRVKRLQETGVIARRVAIVDPDKVGLGLTVFVSVRTNDHSEAWLRKFSNAARKIPEIVEFYRLAGDIDYMMKLLVRDVGDYDRVYRKLIEGVPIADVTASFAMETLKNETAVPI